MPECTLFIGALVTLCGPSQDRVIIARRMELCVPWRLPGIPTNLIRHRRTQLLTEISLHLMEIRQSIVDCFSVCFAGSLLMYTRATSRPCQTIQFRRRLKDLRARARTLADRPTGMYLALSALCIRGQFVMFFCSVAGDLQSTRSPSNNTDARQSKRFARLQYAFQ